jgi:hypothetical protein
MIKPLHEKVGEGLSRFAQSKTLGVIPGFIFADEILTRPKLKRRAPCFSSALSMPFVNERFSAFTSFTTLANSGLGPSELRELRQLREENGKLKRLVADLSLDRHILQEIVQKKL